VESDKPSLQLGHLSGAADGRRRFGARLQQSRRGQRGEPARRFQAVLSRQPRLPIRVHQRRLRSHLHRFSWRRRVRAAAAVSWVLTSVVDNEHSSAPPVEGQFALQDVITALTATTQAWAKTALFSTYDENGGFFDHVPPPTPEPGTAGEFLGGVPRGAGEATGESLMIMGPSHCWASARAAAELRW